MQVRVRECRGPYPSGTTLNFGNTINLYGACNNSLLFLVPPAANEVMPPAAQTVITVTPPVAPRVIGINDFVRPILVRTEEAFDAEWLVINRGLDLLTITSATCNLGTMIPAADPPFVGPAIPGVLWENNNNRIVFSGQIAPGDTLRVPFQAQIPAGADCRQALTAIVNTASCGQSATDLALIAGVPEKWEDGHLILSTGQGELHRFRPNSGLEAEPWICLPNEYTRSLSATPGGALWMVGYPHYRIDPITLEVWMLGYGFLPEVGMSFISEVAEDANGLVYFGGTVESGQDNLVSVVMWDPVSNTSAIVWQEQSGAVGDVNSIGAMHLTETEILALTTAEGVVSFPLSDPTSAVLWSDPVMTFGYDALTPLDDGRFVTCDPVWGSGQEALVAIEPANGTHNVLLDLNALPGHDTMPYTALTADENNHLYLVTRSVSYPQ